MKNVFVLGLDAYNRRKLASIQNAGAYRFHNLLDVHDLKGAETYAFEALLAEARRTLNEFTGRVDAIINFWDFPANAIHAILCDEFDVPGPSLQAVMKCSHKYWSRREQAQVIPDHVPHFRAFDPFDDEALEGIDMAYPFWIKPVLSYSGYLGFRVENEQDFRESVQIIRENIDRYAGPLDELLQRFELPPDVRHVDARWCLAEQIISGHQCTVEGFSRNGKAQTFGLIDSHRLPNGVSFSRYEYPSSLPYAVKDRIDAASERVIEHLGYDNAAFNIEYFHDVATDKLWLLEINPRISQSHSDLFQKVDGTSNHEVVVEVALGNRPRMPHRAGDYHVAAKMFVRRLEDGIVRRAPTPAEVARVQAAHPGTLIVVPVQSGMRLSDLLDQDSYSYQIAIVYAGAENQDALMAKYESVVDALNFDIVPVLSPQASPDEGTVEIP